MSSQNRLIKLIKMGLRCGAQVTVILLLLEWVFPGVVYAQGNMIFSNGNIYAVQNDPTGETMFTLRTPTTIAMITTYHWNNGRGARPGTIALMGKSGEVYGPWQTTGRPGQGGVPNAYWDANVNISLPAGEYIVIDSDVSTWAQNSASRGAGFVTVEGSVGEAESPSSSNEAPAVDNPPGAGEQTEGLEPGAEEGDVCGRLWTERNAIYKAKGYCFNTQRAIDYFGNAGCSYTYDGDTPLSAWERRRISDIQAEERARGCQ